MNYYGVQCILDDEKIGISDRITNRINERGRKRCINYQKNPNYGPNYSVVKSKPFLFYSMTLVAPESQTSLSFYNLDESDVNKIE